MPNRRRAETDRNGPRLRLASSRLGSPAAPRRWLPDPPMSGAPPGSLPPGTVEVHLRVDSEQGLIEARRRSRELAARAGFTARDQAIVAAIVSELGRNILLYARRGEIATRLVEDSRRVGISIVASDLGPGIRNVPRALTDGFSTVGRPGIGLPGVRRLADEFELASGQSAGTQVTVRKWLR